MLVLDLVVARVAARDFVVLRSVTVPFCCAATRPAVRSSSFNNLRPELRLEPRRSR